MGSKTTFHIGTIIKTHYIFNFFRKQGIVAMTQEEINQMIEDWLKAVDNCINFFSAPYNWLIGILYILVGIAIILWILILIKQDII